MTQRLRGWWRRPGGGAEVMRIAWPLIVSNSFWTIQILIDRILLSQQSSEAGAAAMAAAMLFWTPLTLFQFTVNYATTFVAQYTGAGRPERTGPAVWQAYRFALLAGVGCVGLVPLVDPLVAAVGHTARLQELEATYLRCLCFAALPILLTAAACS